MAVGINAVNQAENVPVVKCPFVTVMYWKNTGLLMKKGYVLITITCGRSLPNPRHC